jgi:hypothetical protein
MPARSFIARSVPAALIVLAGSAAALGAGPFGAAIGLGSLNGPNGFLVPGVDASDRCGRSVSNAGDVNGDGIEDFLVGAYFANPGGGNSVGQAYVIFGKVGLGALGSIAPTSLNGTNGFRITGIGSNDRAGQSVSGAGDVDGDGYDDILVGAINVDPNGQNAAGATYLVFGGPTVGAGGNINLASLNGTNGFVMNGIDANDYSGTSVSGAGDTNGDGFDDILIGAPRADANGTSTGESYLVFGGPTVGSSGIINLSALNGSNGCVLFGRVTLDQSGDSVSGAGDINGDGYADVIIGARLADPGGRTNAGEFSVVFGRPTPVPSSRYLADLNGTDGFLVTGIDAYDGCGTAVSGAGDVNGDGFDDILIGASYADPGGRSAAGEAYIVFGGLGVGASGLIELSALDDPNGFTIIGIDTDDLFGNAVSGAGDINSDGYDDIIIGAYGADPGGRSAGGESYIVFGRSTIGSGGSIDASSLNGTTGFTLFGVDTSDISGISVGAAGDVNADGVDDIVIGAHLADPNGQSGAGESYVVFGRLGQVWTSFSSGAWSTGSRWLSGVAPTRGTVVIDPQFGVTVTGPAAGAQLARLILGADFGTTTLDLAAGSVITVSDEDLIIPASAAIAGSGTLAVDAGIETDGLIAPDTLTLIATSGIVNQGLIDIAPTAAFGPAATLDLHGAVQNLSAGDILLRSGPVELTFWDGLENSGHLDIVLADATIFGDVFNDNSPAGAINITAESDALFADDITNNSSIVLGADCSLTILGVLSGNGVSGPGGAGTAGPVFLGGGVSPGQSPGIAVFDGDATLGATALTTIEISGIVPGAPVGGHDQVVVAGVLSAAGTLRVSTPGGFIPLPGHAYKVLDFGSIVGSFSSIQLSTTLVKANADTSTLYTDGTIRIPTPSCTGDINNDGSTNAADFTILAGNFGASVTPNTNGDLNGDGLVNAADFTILAGDFGCAG